MDTQTKLELVDRFLLGQMSREEVIEFEHLMAEDPEIRAFADSQRKLIKGMEKYQEKADFFNMLEDIKKDKLSQKDLQPGQVIEPIDTKKIRSSGIRKLRFRLAVAAGFALLVTAIFFMLDTRVDPSALASTHFSFHSDLLSDQLAASGATDEINKTLVPLLHQGIQLYNQGNYEQAKEEFQKFKDQAKSRDYLVILNDFYLAQIALYQDQPEETIKLLKQIDAERGLPIEASTKWYLALAYLKTHDIDNAKKFLEDLQTNVDYGPQVNIILNKLN